MTDEEAGRGLLEADATASRSVEIAMLTPIHTGDTPSTLRVFISRRAWGKAMPDPKTLAATTTRLRMRFTGHSLRWVDVDHDRVGHCVSS